MLCECGCGLKVKPRNRYVNGHNSRGKSSPNKGRHYTIRPDCPKKMFGLSDTHKKNIGLSSLDRKMSEENRQKARERMIGPNNPMYGRTGALNPFYGKHHTKEEKIRMYTTERNKKVGLGNKGISKPGKENAIKGAPKIAARRKLDWQDSVYREKQLKLVAQGMHIRPTKPELELERIIEIACPNEYIYTGDGCLLICGRWPDFTNVNGKKKVIEMFGDYWHKEDNPQDKIDIYAEFGFDCLVIWEHELKEKSEQELVETIRKFNELKKIIG